jgi:hypothetical protein
MTMALKRINAFRKSAPNGVFARAVVYYDGDYFASKKRWPVEVLANEVTANPTDLNILDAANTKAVALYNAWTAALNTSTSPIIAGPASTTIIA